MIRFIAVCRHSCRKDSLLDLTLNSLESACFSGSILPHALKTDFIFLKNTMEKVSCFFDESRECRNSPSSVFESLTLMPVIESVLLSLMRHTRTEFFPN